MNVDRITAAFREFERVVDQERAAMLKTPTDWQAGHFVGRMEWRDGVQHELWKRAKRISPRFVAYDDNWKITPEFVAAWNQAVDEFAAELKK